MYARKGVLGPRATGDHTDAWAPGQFALCVSHHGGAAFLSANGHLDVGIVQAIEYSQIAFAWYAKNVVNPLGDQLVNENVAAQATGLGCG